MRKVSLLDLVEELKNVSKACRIMKGTGVEAFTKPSLKPSPK